MTAETIASRLRRALMILGAVIFLGTLGELVLEEHTKEPIQYLPFFLCTLGIAALVLALALPRKNTLLVLRGVMGLNALGGLVGLALHLYNNFALEHEMRPNAGAVDLLVYTLKGANPLLAPGIMIFAAVMVVIATYYHPALRTPDES